MREISLVPDSFYKDKDYVEIEKGIYLHNGRYSTALNFLQEPELGEGKDAADISQYPLEDILDRFSVYVSDFFADLNLPGKTECTLEFSGFSLEDVRALRSIIGKHVYNRTIHKDGQDYVELVIE